MQASFCSMQICDDSNKVTGNTKAVIKEQKESLPSPTSLQQKPQNCATNPRNISTCLWSLPKSGCCVQWQLDLAFSLSGAPATTVQMTGWEIISASALKKTYSLALTPIKDSHWLHESRLFNKCMFYTTAVKFFKNLSLIPFSPIL